MSSLGRFVQKQMEIQTSPTSQTFLKAVAFGIIFLWIDRISFNESPEKVKSLRLAHVKTVTKTLGVKYDDELQNSCEGTDNLGAEWASVEVHAAGKYAHLMNSPFQCRLAPEADIVKPLKDLYISMTTYKNMARVFASVQSDMNLLLNGPPGIGKTKIIEGLAVALGFKCVRINLSANTTFEDLMGSFIPRMVGGKRRFEFVRGEMLKALEDSERTWILLDELNLAPPQLLEKLMPVFARHSELRLDATGEIIKLNHPCIFATKNPENVGGGRTRLSASIESHFVAINLTDFSMKELEDIALSKMLPDSKEGPVSKGCIPYSLVPHILDFHSEIAQAASRREVGAQMSGLSFNLRDIVKFICAAETNSEFHRLSAGDIGTESNAVEIEGVRLLLDLIYTRRLTDRSDKEKARDMIDRHFPSKITKAVDLKCDESLQEFVRIGFIYLKKGNFSNPRFLPFSHSEEMLQNLVELAAATRTGLTILLQGGNASGKTALVVELARLCQQKLIVFQMNNDTTVSDLLGAWTVNNANLVEQKVFEKIKYLLKNLCHLCVKSANDVFVFDTLVGHYQRHAEMYNGSDIKLDAILNATENLKEVLKGISKALSKVSQHKIDELGRMCNDLSTELQNADSSTALNFSFVEGPLVEAIRKGFWVLLDNLGQAPGDVLERLNPLAEAEPVLALTESGTGEILTREEGIHPNFRLFATNNTERSRQNQLSSAFRNRCIDMHLDTLDDICSCNNKACEGLLCLDLETVKLSPAYSLVLHELEGLSEKEHIANVLCLVHFNVKYHCRSKTLQLVRGYEVTYRNLRSVANSILHHVRKGINPLTALTSSVLRCYCNPTVTENDKLLVREILVSALKRERQSFQYSPFPVSSCQTELTDIDLCVESTQLLLAVLNAFLFCMTKITSDCDDAHEVILKNIANIVENFLSPLIPNSTIIAYKDDASIKSIGMLATSWIAGLEKAKIFIERFTEFHDIQRLSKKTLGLIERLKGYVGKTSFSGAKDCCNILQSLRSYFLKLAKLGEEIKLLYNTSHTFSSDESLVCIRSIVDQFQVLNSLIEYSSHAANCGHTEILRLMLDQMRQVKDSDSAYQRMSFALSTIERGFSLPIIGSEDHRQHAISVMFVAFPELQNDKRVQSMLARMEVLAAKLTMLRDTPYEFLKASMNESISRVTLAKMNAFHLLTILLNKHTSSTTSMIRLQERIVALKVQARNLLKKDVQGLTDLIEALDVAIAKNPTAENNDLLISAHETANKVMSSIRVEFMSFLEVKSSEEMVEFETMVHALCKNGRHELLRELSNNVNDGLYDRHSIMDAMKKWNEVVPVNVMLDIIAFFDFALLSLMRQNGLRLKIQLFEEIKSENDLEEFLFSDHRIDIVIIFSTVDGCLLWIDLRGVSTMNTLKTHSFTPQNDSRFTKLLPVIDDLCQLHQITLEKRQTFVEELKIEEFASLIPVSLILMQTNFEEKSPADMSFELCDEDVTGVRNKALNLWSSLTSQHDFDHNNFSLLSTSEKLHQAMKLVEEAENEQNIDLAFNWICKRFKSLHFFDLSKKATKEWHSLKDALLSATIGMKSRILRVIEKNSAELKKMHVFESIRKVVTSPDVRCFNVLCCILNECHKQLNLFLKKSISSKAKAMTCYELVFNSCRHVEKTFQILVKCMTTNSCGLICPVDEFLEVLDKASDDTVSFFKHHFNSDASAQAISEDFRFDSESVRVNFLTACMENCIGKTASTTESQLPVNEVFVDRMNELSKKLVELTKKAHESGIDLISQKIAEKMLILKEMEPSSVTEAMLRTLKKDLDKMERDLQDELEVIAEEKKEYSLANIEGLEKIKSFSIVEASQIIAVSMNVDFVSCEEHKRELSRLLEEMSSPNDCKWAEEVSNWVKLLLKLGANQQAAKQVAHISTCLKSADDSLGIHESLLSLKNILDDPNCILLVNEALLAIRNERAFEVPENLIQLLCLLKEERFDALVNMCPLNWSVEKLLSTINFFSASTDLNVGGVWQRVQQLKELEFHLTQHFKLTAPEKQLVFYEENLSLLDFLTVFCPSDEENYEALLRRLQSGCSTGEAIDLDKLGAAFSNGFHCRDKEGKHINLIPEHFADALRERFCEIFASVQSLHKNSDSPSKILLNANFLSFMFRLWSNVCNIAESIGAVDPNLRKSFMRGDSVIDFENRLSKEEDQVKIAANNLSNFLKRYPELQTFQTGGLEAPDSIPDDSQKEIDERLLAVLRELEDDLVRHSKDYSDLITASNEKMQKDWGSLIVRMKVFGDESVSLISQTIAALRSIFPDAIQSFEEKSQFDEWIEENKTEILRLQKCQDDSQKFAITKSCNEIALLKLKAVDLMKSELNYLKKVLGIESPLYRKLRGIICFSSCVITSLNSCLHSVLTFLENDPNKTEKLIEKFLIIQAGVAPLADKVLSEMALLRGGGSLSENEISELIKLLDSLDSLTARVRQDALCVTFEHAKHFVARLLVFCLASVDKVKAERLSKEKMDSIFEKAGLPSFPRGDSQQSVLLSRLVIEHKTLLGLSQDNALNVAFRNGTCAALPTLLDALQEVDKNFVIPQVDRNPMPSQVKGLSEKAAKDSFLNLLNVSLLCNGLKEYLTDFLQTLKLETVNRLTSSELAALSNIVSCWKQLTKTAYDKEQISKFSSFQQMILGLSNLSKESVNNHYGCIELEMTVRDLTKHTIKIRPKLDSFMTNLLELSQKLSVSLASMLINHGLWRMTASLLHNASVLASKELQLADYLNPRYKIEKKCIPSVLMAEFCFFGCQDIAVLSFETFKRDCVYRNLHERFEKTVLLVSTSIAAVEKQLSNPKQSIEMEIQEDIKIDDMDGVKDIEKANLMPLEGKCSWELSQAISSFNNFFEILCDIRKALVALESFPNEWNEAVSILMSWRRKVGEEIAASFEKEREQLQRENEERQRKYDKDVRSFHAIEQEAKAVYCEVKKAILQCYRKLSEEEKKGDVKQDYMELKRISSNFLDSVNQTKLPLSPEESLESSFELHPIRLILNVKKINCSKISWPLHYFAARVKYGDETYPDIDIQREWISGKLNMEDLNLPLQQNLNDLKMKFFSVNRWTKNSTFLFQIIIPIGSLKRGGNQTIFKDAKQDKNSVSIEYSLITDLEPKFSTENVCLISDESSASLLDQLENCRALVQKMKTSAAKFSRGPPQKPEIQLLPLASSTLSSPETVLLYELMSSDLRFLIIDMKKVIEEMEAVAVETQQALEVLGSRDVSLNFLPDVEELAKKMEKLIKIIASAGRLQHQATNVCSKITREKNKYFYQSVCVSYDNDLTCGKIFKKLRPLEEVHIPQQKRVASNTIEDLSRFRRKVDTVIEQLSSTTFSSLKFLTYVSQKSDNDMNKTLSLLESCKELLTRRNDIGHLYNETQKRKNARNKITEKINACVEWKPGNSDLQFLFAKPVPQRSVNLEVEKSSADSHLYCSHREVEINLGVFVKNLDVNDTNVQHVSLLSLNSKCRWKMLPTTNNKSVRICPEDGVVNEGDFFQCNFFPQFDFCTVGHHKMTYILELTDLETSNSCEVLMRVTFSLEDFRKAGLFPTLPVQDKCSVLELGKVLSNNKFEESVEVKNPLSIPMRLKLFCDDSNLTLQNKEIILAPKQKSKLIFTVNTVPNEKEVHISVHAYYSAMSSQMLMIKYTSCKLNVKVLNGKNEVKGSFVKKTFDKMLPNELFTWSELRICNLGSLPVSVASMNVEPSPAGEIEVKEHELEGSETFIVPVHIHPTKEGEWQIRGKLTLAFSRGRTKKDIDILLVIKSHWPNLKVTISSTNFSKDEARKPVKRELKIQNISQVSACVDAVLTENWLMSFQRQKFPVSIKAKEVLSIPLTIIPCLLNKFSVDVTLQSNCENSFQTYDIDCSMPIPYINLSQNVFDIGVLSKEQKKVTVTIQNCGKFGSVKVESKSKTVKLSPSKKFFTLSTNDSEKMTVTVTRSDKATNKKHFFYGCLVFASNDTKYWPFTEKSVWFFGRLKDSSVSDESIKSGIVCEQQLSLDLHLLNGLVTAICRAKVCNLTTTLASLGLVAWLSNKSDFFTEILATIFEGNVPLNIKELFEHLLERSADDEELESDQPHDVTKKLVHDFVLACEKLSNDNRDASLLMSVLSILLDFRWKKDCGSSLLDGLEGAIRVCESFVREKDQEKGNKFSALASAVQKAKGMPIHESLKVVGALAFLLKSELFSNTWIYDVGVAVEGVINIAINKSDNLDNIVRLVLCRQRLKCKIEPNQKQAIEASIKKMHTILLEAPNWNSALEIVHSLHKMTSAINALCNDLTKNQNFELDKMCVEALCLTISPNAIISALGILALFKIGTTYDYKISESFEQSSDVHKYHGNGNSTDSETPTVKSPEEKDVSEMRSQNQHLYDDRSEDADVDKTSEKQANDSRVDENDKGANETSLSQSSDDCGRNKSFDRQRNDTNSHEDEDAINIVECTEEEIDNIVIFVENTMNDTEIRMKHAISALKEMASVRATQLHSLITILSEGSQIVENLEKAMCVIFQKSTWNRLTQRLPNSVLNQIAMICGRIHGMLHICQEEWRKRKVKGKFKHRFRQIRYRIDTLVETLVESFVDHGEQLLDEFIGAGLKLRSKKRPKEFEVAFCSANSLQPFINVRNRSCLKTDSVLENIDLKGHLVVSEYESAKYFSDGIDPTMWMEGGREEDIFGQTQTKLVSETDVRVLLDGETLPRGTTGSPGKRHTKQQKTVQLSFPKKSNDESQTDNATPPSREYSREKIKVRLTDDQKEAMRRRCKEQLMNFGKFDTTHEVAKYRDPEELPRVELNELKYLLLARMTRGLQSKALRILTRGKDDTGKARAEVGVQQQMKFVFLVDNSGSMFGEKMTTALTLLIVFLESMKRLEFSTAVVRFGGEQSQTVLKSFSDKMDNERGQLIIESFDASEKTLSADAVKFVASHDKLYGNAPERNEHRFIILITDGIWSQSEKGTYETSLLCAKASMMVLTTNPSKDKDLKLYDLSVAQAKRILDSISPGAWYGIDAQEDISDQIGHVATILDKKIRDVLIKVSANGDSISNQNLIANISFAPMPTCRPKSNGLQYSTPGNIQWGSSIFASDLRGWTGSSAIDERVDGHLVDKVCEKVGLLTRPDDDTDEKDTAVEECAEIITRLETDKAGFISELTSVLDSVVLPNNRPTRAMQDYHGPTFSLRGFIRFICTDGQYKKIYENIIGYPRKDYNVSVILDTSTSMCGMTAVGSIEAFIGLAASLHGCGVAFSLLTAGTEVHLIKDSREEWGPVSKARAYSAIKFEDQQSNMADAVFYASHLVQQSPSSKAVKIVMVLTDGFDSAPVRLRQSLALAEAHEVMVIGLGLGYFTEGVFDFFNHYVVVNDPKFLPMGLRRFFSGEGSSERPMKEFIEEEKSVESGGRTLTSVREVWDQEMRFVYEEQVKKNRAALYLATAPIRQKCDNFSVNVCFVMDTTGSMSSYISAAKKYVESMAKDIETNIEKSGRMADLRMAFVTYKHFGNPGHLDNHPFSNDIESVMKLVNSMQPTGGCGNEDKFGGMIVAVKDFNWEGTAKFLILIGDVPDHILNCNGCSSCNTARNNRSRGGILELIRKMAVERIHLLYVRVTNRTKDEEIRFKDEYLSVAPDDMKAKGFTLLDITGSNATDNMMSKITEHIDQVIAEEFM